MILAQPLHHSPLSIPTSCSLGFRLLPLKARNTKFSSSSAGHILLWLLKVDVIVEEHVGGYALYTAVEQQV